LVRLPTIDRVTCAKDCTLTGRELFLLAGVGGQSVPEGFTGDRLTFPLPAVGDAAPIRLRDAPDVAATLSLPRPEATP
jgi:hypothetical protein